MPSVCAMPLCLCLALLASMIMPVTSCRELFVCPTSSLCDCPGVPCLTLEKYAEMSDMFITSNIVLKLLPGRHVLTNTFIVQNIENFTIEGQIENDNSPYPVIQYTAENYFMARPVVHFNNSFNITMRAVKFDYVINYHNLDTYRERIEYENASVVTFQNGNDLTIMYSNICMIWSNQDEMETHSSRPFISGFGMEMAKNVNITNTEILGGDMGVITQDGTNIVLLGVRVSNSPTAISINATENVTCNDVHIIESGNTQFEITNSDYITIQNLNVIKQTHVREFRYFIRTHKSSHISILDSVIDTSGNTESRIRMEYGDLIYISNITARHFLFRIGLRHIQNVTISDSEIGGIFMRRTDHVTVFHTSLTKRYEGFFATKNTYTYLYYLRSSEIHMNDGRHQGIFHATITGYTGIGIYNSVHTTISNTTVINSYTDGVVISNSRHTTITNATLSNTNDPGIYIKNSDFTTILYTSVSNTRQVGVRVEGAEHTTLSHITVTNAGVHGIILLDTAHTAVLDVSVNNPNSNGITVHNGTNTTMIHLLVENSGLNGMELSHVNHMIISQVNISKAQWNGMQLRDIENVQMSFTNVKYAQWFGIELCYSSLTSIFNTTVLTGSLYRYNTRVRKECFKQCSYDPTLEITCMTYA